MCRKKVIKRLKEKILKNIYIYPKKLKPLPGYMEHNEKHKGIESVFLSKLEPL